MRSANNPGHRLTIIRHAHSVGWVLGYANQMPSALPSLRELVSKSLEKNSRNPSARTVKSGRRHWTSVFPHLNTWLGQLASTTSSEHGSETISVRGSILDSGQPLLPAQSMGLRPVQSGELYWTVASSTTRSEHGSETSSIRKSILDSGSDRNLGYADKFFARAEKAPNENTMVQATLCGTVQTCKAVCGPILTQVMPSTTGYTGVAAYAQYSAV